MNVFERMTEIFRTVFNDESIELRDEMTARDIEAWDSLANINLMFTIEQEFGVRFRNDQLASFDNVGELRHFLEARTA